MAAAPARPLVPLYDAAGLTHACATGLAKARQMMHAMERERHAGAIFSEWNRLSIALEDVGAPAYLLANVAPDKAVRAAAEPCLVEFATVSSELFQSEQLYRRVRGARTANAHQAKLQRDLLEGFEDSGATLGFARRARARAILGALETLRQSFDHNVRDDPTRVVFTPQDMEGVPAAYLAAQQRDGEGRYVLGLDAATYLPFMANAKSAAARERYYRAKLSEGGDTNLALLEKMSRLRQDLARLYGFPSYAAYALRHRMMRTPQAVAKFLDEIHGAVAEVEKRELDELREAKARDLGTPLEATKLERWDVAYYQEKVRRSRFAIDPEKLRRHFPTDKAIAYTMLVAARLYGVKFREVKVPTWHPDVRYFDVLDTRTGRFLSGFYLDLYPREGKYRQAAAFPIRGASLIARRTSLAALVANLDREGLDPGELATMMREFGELMHLVLSRVDYDPQAGSAVAMDFAEAPSRMFEEWARREQPLALWREVCPACPHLTHDDIERLQAARRYGEGLRYARQWLYATFDMALATDPRPPLALWEKLESATPLGTVEGTRLPASFTHLADGYAAGYYSYLWSRALALDLLAPFRKDMLDAAVGRRYRETILAQGGQREEAQMVRDFLGREPSSHAFVDEITGRRR